MRLVAVLAVVSLLAALGWWLLSSGGSDQQGPRSDPGDTTTRQADQGTTETDTSAEEQGAAERVALPDRAAPRPETLDPATPSVRFTVSVTSLDDGSAIEEARCRMRWRWSDKEVATGLTDAQGHAALDGLETDAEYELVVEAEGFALDVRPVPMAANHADVVLAPGFPLRGRVLDAATSQPVAAAWVQVRDGWSRHKIGQARPTDAAGEFVHPGIPIGHPVEITVSKHGYVPLVEQEAWDQEPAPLEFLLGDGASVAGRISGPDGGPVGGAHVMVERLGQQGRRNSPSVSSEEDGTYRLSGLPAEASYQVVAQVATGMQGRSEVFRVESTQDRLQVDVRMDVLDTGLRVEVHNQVGEPLEDLPLVVLDEQTSEMRNGRTDDAGVCLVAPLDPGPYTVRLRLGDRPLEIHPVDVEEGRLSPLRIVVQEGASLHGTVVDAAGDPVEGQEVAFWFEVPMEKRDVISMIPDFAAEGSSWNHASTFTGADGAFRLEGLPEQTGVLRVGDVLGFDGDEFIARWGSVELFDIVPGPDPLEVLLPAAARVIARITPVPAGRTVLCQVNIGTSGWYHDVPVSEDGDLELGFTRVSRPLALMIDPQDGAAWFYPALTLEPDSELDLGVLRQQPGGVFEGVVRDSAGQSLAGAHVGVELDGFWWERDTLTDDTGAFRLDNLPSGSGRWVVDREGFSPVHVLVADLGQDLREDPVLTRPGEVLVEVVDTAGNPVAGVRVKAELLGEEALPSYLRSKQATSDAAGGCTLTLRAGRHLVGVRSPAEGQAVEVTVEESGTATVRLVFQE